MDDTKALIDAINELNKNIKFLTLITQELNFNVDSPDNEDVHSSLNPNFGVEGKPDRFVQYVRLSK